MSIPGEILTGKCNLINPSSPAEVEEEGEPIPEMLRTIVQDDVLATGVVERNGQ